MQQNTAATKLTFHMIYHCGPIFTHLPGADAVVRHIPDGFVQVCPFSARGNESLQMRAGYWLL